MCKSKKIFVLLLILVMTMCMIFVGCTPRDENPTDASDNTVVTTVPDADGTEPVVESTGEVTETTTESTTEATTEATVESTGATEQGGVEETTAPSEPANVNVLSDDPFSYQISIDGTVLQLPCSASEFAELGWVMKETQADNTLDENYTTGVNVYCGDCYITLSIYNDSDSAVKFSEAMVDDVSIHDISVDGHEIFICGGLTIGSTKDEVKAVYGNEPTREYTDETSFSSLSYEGDSYRYRVGFSFKDDVVIGIDICSG